jgi:hypothetical protein
MSARRQRTKRFHLVAVKRCWNFLRAANALPRNDLRRVAPKSCQQKSKILERQSVLLATPDQRTFKMHPPERCERDTKSQRPRGQSGEKRRDRATDCGSLPPDLRPRMPSQSIPEWIRTTNLRLRRPTLYPVELRGRESAGSSEQGAARFGIRVPQGHL